MIRRRASHAERVSSRPPGARGVPPLLLLLLGLLVGRSEAETVALVGATVHPVSSAPIERGTVIFSGGNIQAVGAHLTPPADARIVDVEGLHVYPALIDPNTVLGLVEVSSVPGTVDVSETGDINPNARAEVAINPDSEILPVTRANGILVAMTAPRGGLISGTAAVIRLGGWTWEDMTLRAPVGLMVDWPDMRIRTGPNAPSREKQIEDRDTKLRSLSQAFADARAYMVARSAEGKRGVPVHDRDPRWEAMLPALRREIPVMVAADDLQQIHAALRWADSENLRLVLLSGGDVWRVASELASRNIPVILQPVHELPRRRWEPYDTPFTTAAKLHAAGVRFCFSYGANAFSAAHARNLPYQAAMAAAYGLPPDEALKGVTQYAADILGVADRLGTLEAGKEATLIVTDGDPLEIRTHVQRAFLAGKELDLDNRHRRLYEKYRNRPQPAQTATEPAITNR